METIFYKHSKFLWVIFARPELLSPPAISAYNHITRKVNFFTISLFHFRMTIWWIICINIQSPNWAMKTVYKWVHLVSKNKIVVLYFFKVEMMILTLSTLKPEFTASDIFTVKSSLVCSVSFQLTLVLHLLF